MKARDLRPGQPVPSGVVQGTEVHTAKVVVWLVDGRVWVYDWADDVDAVQWWIGGSIEYLHVCKFGPWKSREAAQAAKLNNQLRGRVFPLPIAHHRAR